MQFPAHRERVAMPSRGLPPAQRARASPQLAGRLRFSLTGDCVDRTERIAAIFPSRLDRAA